MNEQENSTQTIDNGETEVQVATLGTVVGTGADGEPVEQHFTEDALQAIADKQDDILVDVDHESEREGKTAAAGWLKKLHLVPGKGLFGKISWTDIGRKLVDNRVFRFLSPAFIVDRESREPLAMTSCALTNKPSQAGKIAPIINQAPAEESNLDNNLDKPEEEISDMDIEKLKEQLKEELLETLREEVASMNACAKEQEDAGKALNEDDAKAVDEEAKPEAAQESKEKADIVAVVGEDAGEAKPEEVTEEIVEKLVEEPAKEEEKEVIKIESLNSAPAPTLAPQAEKWRTMNPDEFRAWIDAGMPK